MTRFSTADRQVLHDELDQLLDQRDILERVAAGGRIPSFRKLKRTIRNDPADIDPRSSPPRRTHKGEKGTRLPFLRGLAGLKSDWSRTDTKRSDADYEGSSHKDAGTLAYALDAKVLSFASRVIGNQALQRVLPRQLGGERMALMFVLRRFRSLLPEPNQPDAPLRFSLNKALHAIRALDAGDVFPVFKPAVGRNRSAGRYELAKYKLLGCLWLEHHEIVQPKREGAWTIVGDAFGTDPSTVPGWKKSCSEILGEWMYEVWQAADFSRPESFADLVLEDGRGSRSLTACGRMYLELSKTSVDSSTG